MKNRTKIKGLSRIESGSTKGWFVRVYRDGKCVHSKLFSDGKYGGRLDARIKAIEYRDEMEKQFAPDDQRIRFRRKPQANNSTGVNGVSHTFRRNRDGTTTPCYSVTWYPEPGVAKNKKFPYHDESEKKEAFKQACWLRKVKESEMLAS